MMQDVVRLAGKNDAIALAPGCRLDVVSVKGCVICGLNMAGVGRPWILRFVS